MKSSLLVNQKGVPRRSIALKYVGEMKRRLNTRIKEHHLRDSAGGSFVNEFQMADLRQEEGDV